MSYSAPNPLPYKSSSATTATKAGVPRRLHPLPDSCPIQFAAYAFEQDFQILLSAFPPADKNTPANNSAFGLSDANAILTSLTLPSDEGGGQGRFTARFSIVPASWDEFVTQAVTFPGIRDTAYTGGVREPKSLNVTTRVHRDYFVIDPSAILATAGVVDSGGSAIRRVATKGHIPIVYRTPWKFLYSGSILSTSEVTSLVKAGGVGSYLETVPNTGTYQSWISVASAFNAALLAGGSQAWDETHPPVWDGLISPSASIGQFRFTDSRLEEYEGNIVCRITETVLAQ